MTVIGQCIYYPRRLNGCQTSAIIWEFIVFCTTSSFCQALVSVNTNPSRSIQTGGEDFGQLGKAPSWNVNLLSAKQPCCEKHQKSENPLFMLHFFLLKCALTAAISLQRKTAAEHFSQRQRTPNCLFEVFIICDTILPRVWEQKLSVFYFKKRQAGGEQWNGFKAFWSLWFTACFVSMRII